MLIWLLFCEFAAAAWWAASLTVCLGLTKMVFYMDARRLTICAAQAAILALVSWFMEQSRWLRRSKPEAGIACCWSGGRALILSIAASRLLLQAHNLPEVSLGCDRYG